MSQTAPIIVVGGGIAGLVTALAAAPAPVVLLMRNAGSNGAASALAQGGIAAAHSQGDSPAAHARDTCAAGSHHNDAAMVDVLTRSAADAIDWLQRLGVAFDRNDDGTLQLGREGGHDRSRIVHAGGDATGAVVMAALVAAARNAVHIERHTGVDVDGLMLRNGGVSGVCITRRDGSQSALEGCAVVLATGGIGGLFAHTSNPPDADGSGLALAIAAGADTRDLEFVQFHPTALAVPGLHSLPLVTEALRGAGAHLHDAQGRALMKGVHPLGDLAPRDVVARQVWAACEGEGAWLDARAIGDVFTRDFPTVLAACLAHGIDPRSQPIPVRPAAHFHMGGIHTDADGRTSLPGLFAVGEVACNGVHGANRLASNSLLEGVVFGRRLGQCLRDIDGAAAGGRSFKFLHRGPSLDAAQLTRMRHLMTQAMGPLRTGSLLQVALRDCDALACVGWQGALARALVSAALRRRRSLGAHFRDDGPLSGHSTKGAWRVA
ncbi:L-aspartate oxidase [Aerolutibacter ruishenii]|uniref:L-aspartate oxidase n=1 Tax=Aerolutibacter ruishenii TaxID=686800 RepID=A0A562LXZ2_9GAMM|nr:L-aspartate oxidase [Lysobacter ruishenii]TWI12500.1 L-aspartate oxidase [Lysobacter ruishenii]